jgi:small subunit ribosomal protein S1
VKILEIDSERRRLSLSVKRVEEQLPHIRSAAEAGAAAAAEAGGGQDIGDVPDLGLSEDVFAGPSISGADALRAALPRQEAPAEEAPAPAGEEAAAAAQPEAELPEAEPAPEAVDAEPSADTSEDAEPSADTSEDAEPASPDQDEEQPAEQ